MITGNERTDHRNRNGLDNQRKNLRPATKAENARNLPAMRKVATSRYKGVSLHTLNGRWRARIKTDTGRVSLGVYATEEEAARAYDAAARVYHGEFAYLNFPDEKAS
jgi:AP2 domain